jgi:acyl-CoA synthetase (NDP forming)
MPQPCEAAREVLEARIPEFGSTANPVDLTAQVINDPECLPACADALMNDDNYGALVIPLVYSSPMTAARLPIYEELVKRVGKPVIMVWTTEWLEGPGAIEFEQSPQVCLFRSMDRAYAGIAEWHRQSARHQRPPRQVIRRAPQEAVAQAKALIAKSTNQTLTERESKEIFSRYGIPVVGERLVQSAEEAAAAATELGLPVVLKVESPDLPHKTEAGVIRLNLRTPDEVRAAYAAVMANAHKVSPPPRINGMLVQPMVPEGVEIMIGARVDPLFGPLVVVGLGGILVELLKDSSVGLAPVTHEEATTMLTRLKGAAALNGFRGSPPVDIEKLADLVGRVSEFIADHRDTVAEIDVNPLICAGSRIMAVDALIVKA